MGITNRRYQLVFIRRSQVGFSYLSSYVAKPNTDRKMAIQNVMGRMAKAYCTEGECALVSLVT